MTPFTRRDFLKTSIAAGTLASVTASPLHAAPPSATDTVPLGKCGVNVTRLAFGTGSDNGYVQAALGQQEFNRLIAYAYERGIRFFETAEAYATPAMLGAALKPFPRESYQLMTKVTTTPGVDPHQRFDQMRRTSQTEYFSNTKHWQDAILQAQSKKTILARGASVHGLPALRQMPDNHWLEVAMIRMNHNGTRMDGPTWEDNNNPSDVSEVVDHVKKVHSQGMGVVSMKLVGAGTFIRREDRQAAMRFAFRNAGVDAVTVGFKNTQEIDEAISNLNLAFA
jgi:predicted aldo/keto reductase-like oxidoreductase